jgi:hypothetical protein
MPQWNDGRRRCCRCGRWKSREDDASWVFIFYFFGSYWNV